MVIRCSSFKEHLPIIFIVLEHSIKLAVIAEYIKHSPCSVKSIDDPHAFFVDDDRRHRETGLQRLFHSGKIRAV